MQNCAQCGTPLSFGAITCPRCGNVVAYTAPSWNSLQPGSDAVSNSDEIFQLPFPTPPPSNASSAPASFSAASSATPAPFATGMPSQSPFGPPAPSLSQQGINDQAFTVQQQSPNTHPSPYFQDYPNMPTSFQQSQPLSYPGMPVSPQQSQPLSYPGMPTSFQQSQPFANPGMPVSPQESQPLSYPDMPFPAQQSQPLAYPDMPFPEQQSPAQFYNNSPAMVQHSPASQYQNPAPFQEQAPVPPYGGMPAPPQQASPAPAIQPPSNAGQGLSRKMLISVTVATVLLILSGISLIYYTAVARPAQLRGDATATAQAINTNNAHALATANAYVTATAISFAHANATAQARAQATANAIQATYTQSTNRVPTLDSSLAFQDQSNWDVYSAVGGGGCAFTGGSLHSSIGQKQFYVPCFAHATNFDNFVLQVDMKIIKGDEGGVIFRGNDTTSKFYYLRIGRDGIYSLNVSRDDKHSTPILFDTSSAIKTGAGQTNQISIIAKGHTIYLYINKKFIASTTDPSYLTGEIGVFAGDNHNATDVAFNNARVWQL